MYKLWLAALVCSLFTLACSHVDDDGNGGCQVVNPPAETGGLWPEQVDGPTACDRTQPLVSENTGDILFVRGAAVGQSHCSEIYVTFYDEDAWCGFGGGNAVASLYFIGNGAGTYTATQDELTCERGPNGEVIGPPPGQDPYGIQADRTQATAHGTGEVAITSDAGLDTEWTVGTVDVMFDDGTRLLADFAAPLCMTE